MKHFIYTLATFSLIIGVLGALCFYVLSNRQDEPAKVLSQFEFYENMLSPAKYILPVVLLVIADKMVWQRNLKGRPRTFILWSPFFAFVVYSTLHWGFVGDAYIHYNQAAGLWQGGFSAALFFMGFAYPPALGLTLVNHVILGLMQRQKDK